MKRTGIALFAVVALAAGCLATNDTGDRPRADDLKPDRLEATGVVEANKDGASVPVFRADHPFIFLIRDTRSDSVLFLGRIVDPTN